MKEHKLGLFFTVVMISITFFNNGYFGGTLNKQPAAIARGNQDLTASVREPERRINLIIFSNLNPIRTPNFDFEVSSVERALEREIYNLMRDEVALVPEVAPQAEEQKEETKPNPEPQAAAAIIYDLTTEETLFALNPERVWPLASVTKLMTAVVAAETLGFDTLVTINEEAIRTPEIAGNFYPEELFNVRDILTSLFLVSSNDGAVALALYNNQEQFVAAMNQKAKNLFLGQTFFKEPTGLSSQNVSTGQDLTRLVSYIYKERPELLYFSRQAEAEIHDFKFGNVKQYKSINKFAGQPNFIGGKTGYTDEAGGNLVSIFSKNGRAILIVVLGTEDRFQETERLLEWVEI